MSDHISQKVMGCRVKAAREAKGLTQDELAKGLGFNDRQSISDIETGKRGLKAEEMLTLSELLDRDLEFFIDPFAVSGEAEFSWRASPEMPEDVLNGFELKAGQWIGLLRWLREGEGGRTSVLKHALRISSQSSYEDAQVCAERLVAELGLGELPATGLIDGIERKLDIPVLFVDTAGTAEGHSISGATCHLNELGVLLINRHESEARRFFDLAHELFHALTWDAMKPDHRESNAFDDRNKVKRIEQLANNFAAALLMPQASLESLIAQDRINDVDFLCDVAERFRVSPGALAWRLFNAKMIGAATRDALAREKQRPSDTGTPVRFSLTFIQLLHDALNKGRLSARKAAKALGLGLGGLAELFGQHNLKAPYDL
jgi:Zn-dependent peptidase ImmA (M78 family)/transcriptional regulator with XRE-family HTH domain